MSLELGYSSDLYPPTKKQEHPARSTAPAEECEYVKYHRPRDRPRALRGSASVIGGTGRRSATSAQPGNPREPGLREVAGEATRTTGQVNAKLHCVFPVFEKMTVDGHDITKVIAEVEATSWCLRETIQVRKLGAPHRLGQMRCLMMLEEQKAWKREFGFDRI